MRPIIEHARTHHTPETLAQSIRGMPGLILLYSSGEQTKQARYSFVVARPFLTLRTWGSRCETQADNQISVQYGNPWRVFDQLLSGCELIDQID